LKMNAHPLGHDKKWSNHWFIFAFPHIANTGHLGNSVPDSGLYIHPCRLGPLSLGLCRRTTVEPAGRSCGRDDAPAHDVWRLHAGHKRARTRLKQQWPMRSKNYTRGPFDLSQTIILLRRYAVIIRELFESGSWIQWRSGFVWSTSLFFFFHGRNKLDNYSRSDWITFITTI
jgi:hypothetical protein